MEEIEVKSLTKDYGHGRGIYDVSFTVHKGEVFGFLGPNGAGKSTTMRHLMGFSKPQSGEAFIHGLSCWKDHARVMREVGYIPGEVALPEGLNGAGFLQMMQGLRKSPSSRITELLDLFEMDPSGSMKRMSIGEKRKLAIVAAFMGDPDTLLLDEPTSGLDPVMQEVFIDFVKGEKEKGKTVLLSSHIFSEVEALCDRIAIIKEGKIISTVNADDVKHFKRKTFDITFADEDSYRRFPAEGFEIRQAFPEERKVSVAVDDSQSDAFIKRIVNYTVKSFVENPQTLEDYFMHFYKSDRSFGDIAHGKRKRH
ncbi:ABC transporter ATP-binding protein [Collinsella sp. An2]|uniref:ABC transporter ATP-binding protein n=1 Tax=Collinsella sp. An2 TaxID=1965585 RepID=UPI000B3794B6|nr:ABC transporter ATP-binding protein [Collinsella sp. An2]OUP08017.1 ABC transporter ATP-binding protein [Collinsella sp. An2]